MIMVLLKLQNFKEHLKCNKWGFLKTFRRNSRCMGSKGKCTTQLYKCKLRWRQLMWWTQIINCIPRCTAASATLDSYPMTASPRLLRICSRPLSYLNLRSLRFQTMRAQLNKVLLKTRKTTLWKGSSMDKTTPLPIKVYSCSKPTIRFLLQIVYLPSVGFLQLTSQTLIS